jgi:5-methylcytosine-specific restriction endonuclease McrA
MGLNLRKCIKCLLVKEIDEFTAGVKNYSHLCKECAYPEDLEGKICRNCGKEFVPNKRNGSYCIPCQNKKAKQNYEERKNIPLYNAYKRAKVHEHKARKLGLEIHFTGAELIELFDIQEKQCHYCKSPLEWAQIQIDHKIPYSEGGGNNIENIAIVCTYCNRDKLTLTEVEYFARQQNKSNWPKERQRMNREYPQGSKKAKYKDVENDVQNS